MKNSKKDSNCKNFVEVVESTHTFGSTIYFVVMTTTSSGDKYILAQMHTNVHSSVLERNKKRIINKFKFHCF